jgi:hypothetical protein
MKEEKKREEKKKESKEEKWGREKKKNSKRFLRAQGYSSAVEHLFSMRKGSIPSIEKKNFF